MSDFPKNPRRFAPWVAAFVVTFTAASLFVARVQAQQPPYALLERSTLTASGNTINAIQVPVVLASGIIVYLNLSLQFVVDSTGNMTLASGFPQVSLSPILLTGSFVAGKYVNSGRTLNLTGPGVLDGGVTQWNFVDSCGSGTWYAGPITSSPLAARLKAANITSTAYSYGISSGSCVSNLNNGLIGVSQVGNTLSIFGFTGSGGSGDVNLPVSSLTWTLAP